MATVQPTVAIVSLTDPRATAHAQARERYIEDNHLRLVKELSSAGFTVVDPLAQLRKGWKDAFGLRTTQEIQACSQAIQAGGPQALVCGLWHWTEPQLVLLLARATNLPICLYANDDPTWAGVTAVTASGASLWEVGVTPSALVHQRIRGDIPALIDWARGICALQILRRSTLLLWGGSYCLRMEHLMDDVAGLKTFLVGDILSEDTYLLIRRAENIKRSQPDRIAGFINWLRQGRAEITFDGKMLTEEILADQVATYLAARDRLEELKDEPIVGVSIRCQPELSEEYARTGCFLPAFLPFSEDSEGKRQVVPTVCEGDIKGLITCALLHLIQPQVPPLFGDLKYIAKDYIIISNCGASSVYYAAGTADAARVLPGVRITPQCQGAGGGAVGYDGAPAPLTVARLARRGGDYLMQLGKGEALPITPEITKNILWGKCWPHIAIRLEGAGPELFNTAASNHYCATTGNVLRQLHSVCREAGIGWEPLGNAG